MARKKSKESWKVYKNVFDEFTLRTLFRLESQGFFSGLTSAYRLGKEANIFIADNEEKDVIVKIYRLENCNFNKMHSYLSQDERYHDLKGQKRKIVFSWVQREYRNLLIAREAIRVPTPLAIRDNVLVLEMIGKDGPAPELKDARPKNPEQFLDKILLMVKRLKDHGLVHGDLSAFNILNHEEEPVFIDFSQATTTKSSGWEDLLRRDVENVLNHFKKLGIERDSAAILEGLHDND
ncbi:phosphotransferase [Candidatus Woesearchaeota archaeon]|nr:phosphotransferase [Candidatus Woesearchaeota archaeon]